MRERKRLQALNLWVSAILLAAAVAFAIFYVLPRWSPILQEFFSGLSLAGKWPLLVLSVMSALISQRLAPCSWERILRALGIRAPDSGAVRRNWYESLMGSYIPGKFWMFIGRITFLRTLGTGPALALGAIALENIYLMVSVCALALVSLPFMDTSTMDLPVHIALGLSVAAVLVMLFVPGIQRILGRWVSHGVDDRPVQIPRISQKAQLVAVGFDTASWAFRGISLTLWFMAATDGSRALALLPACLVATPVSWLVAVALIFFPGGIGVRESVQGLILTGFAGSLAVATTIALSHRVVLLAVEGTYALASAGVNASIRSRPAFSRQVRNIRRLAGSLFRARFARLGLCGPPTPINVTVSVTRRCQSRCGTCYIWKADGLEEMSLESFEAFFRSLGWTYFFNISGGEPFLREDLDRIVRLACIHLSPAVIHIPTNALLPDRIEAMTERMLEVIERESPGTVLTVKPSFDGVGERHDQIRGVPGNFAKLLDTLERLKRLRKSHPALQVGVGTVISRFNAAELPGIIAYADSLGVDTYINEIAEEREEFFNRGSGITPDPATYSGIMQSFKEAAGRRMKGIRLLGRITTALRLVYYDIVVRILLEKRQVIPCYAGLLNVHVNSDGSVWPCAILAYGATMGAVGASADFAGVWRSREAAEIRRSIRRGECFCPLANQAYSNMLMHVPSLVRALLRAL